MAMYGGMYGRCRGPESCNPYNPGSRTILILTDNLSQENGQKCEIYQGQPQTDTAITDRHRPPQTDTDSHRQLQMYTDSNGQTRKATNRHMQPQTKRQTQTDTGSHR